MCRLGRLSYLPGSNFLVELMGPLSPWMEVITDAHSSMPKCARICTISPSLFGAVVVP